MERGDVELSSCFGVVLCASFPFLHLRSSGIIFFVLASSIVSIVRIDVMLTKALCVLLLELGGRGTTAWFVGVDEAGQEGCCEDIKPAEDPIARYGGEGEARDQDFEALHASAYNTFVRSNRDTHGYFRHYGVQRGRGTF